MNNSYKSYEKLKSEGKKTSREQMIITVLEAEREPMTDREVQNKLCDIGYLSEHNRNHLDKVQPRISDLIKDNVVMVCGSKYDELTERNVRTVRLVNQTKEMRQMRLWL